MLRTYLAPFLAALVLLFLLSLPPASHVAQESRVGPPRPLPGATLRFTHLTTDDGLSNSHIDAILQDRYGFMWFGTWDGLERYDGYTLDSFKHDATDPTSLGNNTILDLLEDRNGIIWIATRGGGLNRFDPATETFTRYPYDPDNPNSPSDSTVFSLAEGQNGDLWLGLEDGQINRFDPASETFTRYRFEMEGEGAFVGSPIWKLQVAPGGILWLAMDVLRRVDPVTGQVTQYDPDKGAAVGRGRLGIDRPSPSPGEGPPPGGGGPQPGGEPPGGGPPPQGALPSPQPGTAPPPEEPTLPEARQTSIQHVYLDPSGLLWFAGEGLYRFDSETEQFTAYPFPGSDPTTINDIYVDPSGLFWLGTSRGLQTFEPQSGRFIHQYRHDHSDPGSLGEDMVTMVYGSEEGVLWLGTVEAGLSKLDLWQAQFAYYRNDERGRNRFGSSLLGAIYKDSAGILWVGGSQGLVRFDRSSGQFTSFDPNPSSRRVGSPESHIVSFIYEDEDGFLWLDGVDALYRFDPRTETFQRYLPEGQEALPIWSMSADETGDLWLTAFGALYHFDRQQAQFTSYRHNAADSNSMGSSDLRAVHAGRSGEVWVGSGNGILSRLDRASGQFHIYENDPHDPTTISAGWMQAIYEDRAGNVWIGSMDGLNRYDRASDSFIRYTQRDGLPSAIVVGILEDAQGDLWLSTGRGLSRLDPTTGTVKRNYDVADGLQGNEFGLFAYHQAADGEMFFAGREGLNAFYPEQIRDNPYSPPVILTDIQRDNQSVGVRDNSLLRLPIWQTDQLTLAHNEDNISFEFASLSYAAPKKNRYRYQLEGLGVQEAEVSSERRFAPYTDIPTGSYVLRVQGSNEDGLWSEHEVALTIVVQPPWWETWWFRGSVALLTVALLFSGYRWRIHAMQARNRELEQEVAARTEALVQSNRELQEAKQSAETAREVADAANQAKSTFLANMSHELRSPLNAILGFAQIMGNSPTLGQEDREHMGIIRRSGEHLLTLINQVLDMSKIEANRTTLNEKNFDLHQMLEDLDDMFALKADDKHLTLLFEYDPALPQYLRTDETKLRQVLINLLNNALKFTEEGGVAVRVAVTTRDADHCRLRFEVEDSGPGIAPEEMEQLFEAFGQTATGRKAQEGTGLGLPISRKFVHLMGGEMQVRSQPGQGTVFSFDIEARIVEAEDITPWRATRRVVGLLPGQPRYRILVADDKWTNRQLLFKMLEPLGFEVREAENGQEAIEVWESWEPHLIWMDMRMPVLNGYEAVRHIKSTTKGQATAIIALTASTLEEERAMVLSAGCDEFMRKPFRAADIFDIMHRQIGVQYIYEESSPLPVSQTIEITAAMMAALPQSWLVRFQAALLRLDMEEMLAHLEEIQPQHSLIAQSLKEMVNTFAYEQLALLLQEGNGIERVGRNEDG